MYFIFSSNLSHKNCYLNVVQKQHGIMLHTDEPLFYNTSICPSRIITYQKNTFYKNNSLFFLAKYEKTAPYGADFSGFFDRSNLRFGHENKQACFHDFRLAITF